jgi:hypothetical protein
VREVAARTEEVTRDTLARARDTAERKPEPMLPKRERRAGSGEEEEEEELEEEDDEDEEDEVVGLTMARKRDETLRKMLALLAFSLEAVEETLDLILEMAFLVARLAFLELVRMRRMAGRRVLMRRTGARRLGTREREKRPREREWERDLDLEEERERVREVRLVSLRVTDRLARRARLTERRTERETRLAARRTARRALALVDLM